MTYICYLATFPYTHQMTESLLVILCLVYKKRFKFIAQYVGIVPIYVSNEQTNLYKNRKLMIFIVSYRENVRNFTQGSSGFLSIRNKDSQPYNT